jgi:hypothetical protein
LSGSADESIEMERQHAFLRELSLIEQPRDLTSSWARLRHFDTFNRPLISHEPYMTSIWRFYYMEHPLFYDGNVFASRGSPKYIARILRSVLFIHVVLQHSIEKLQLLENKIKIQVLNLRDKRLGFFDFFSIKKISEFHTRLQEENKARGDMEKEVGRIKEVQIGANKLLLHFEDPGRSLGFPLNHPVVRGASRLIEGYPEIRI